MTFLFGLALLSNIVRQPSDDTMVQIAQDAWMAARAAARSGGSGESLAPAARALAELDKTLEQSRWRLQGVYARSLVAAAMAAAQDERAEMELHLTHARDLSVRLETSAYPAMWPRPFDEAAGELWLEVEEYAEALNAYSRAAARRPERSTWLGLARSARRLQDAGRACEGYRQVMQLSPSPEELKEARDYITRCP